MFLNYQYIVLHVHDITNHCTPAIQYALVKTLAGYCLESVVQYMKKHIKYTE